MPVLASYFSVADFRTRVGRTVSTTEQDDEIAAAIEAASRQIDGYCGRSFGRSESPEPRLYGAPAPSGYPWGWGIGTAGSPCFRVGDVVSLTEIAADDGSGDYATVWDPATYVLAPESNAWKGRPFDHVNPAPGASWSLGWTSSGGYPLRITGTWGWPAVPSQVREATFLLSNRLRSAWTAPFGVSGPTGSDLGTLDMTNSITPLIERLLSPYRVLPV